VLRRVRRSHVVLRRRSRRRRGRDRPLTHDGPAGRAGGHRPSVATRDVRTRWLPTSGGLDHGRSDHPWPPRSTGRSAARLRQRPFQSTHSAVASSRNACCW
jgi:hypothetical protein